LLNDSSYGRAVGVAACAGSANVTNEANEASANVPTNLTDEPVADKPKKAERNMKTLQMKE